MPWMAGLGVRAGVEAPLLGYLVPGGTPRRCRGHPGVPAACTARPPTPGRLRAIPLEYFFDALRILRDELAPGAPVAVLGIRSPGSYRGMAGWKRPAMSRWTSRRASSPQ